MISLSGKSIRKIARITGVIPEIPCANTCAQMAFPSRAIQKSEAPNWISSNLRSKSMAQGIFNCEVLLRLLREQGYSGGITLIKDYVRPHRPSEKIPAVQRYETKPGYKAQVDWKICQYVDVDGSVRKIFVFVTVCGCGGAEPTGEAVVVPWPYSGREVCGTWADGSRFMGKKRLIARHKKQVRPRTLVMCERQYAKLSLHQGNVYPKPLGLRIAAHDVEVRSLQVYERLMEAGT